MAEYVSKDIHPCACGKTVAWLTTTNGGKVPHEIKREITLSTDGTSSVLVSTEDFHNCALYPDLGKFVQDALDRSRKPDICISLPNKKRAPLALVHRQGEIRARVTNGKSGKNEKTYGLINVKTGGYRVRSRPDGLDDLLDLLDQINQNPRKFDWSLNHTQTKCCFCGRFLSNPRSIHWGYGPTCAGNAGLPWY